MRLRHWTVCTAAAAITMLTVVMAGCERHEGQPEGFHVVTVWSHRGREEEHAAMQSIVRAFNEAHASEKKRIVVNFFPDRQYADKVSIAAASSRLPDVVDIDGPYVGPWAAEGLLVPIDAYVDEKMRADFLKTIIEQGTYREHLYALGAFDSALAVYYNRKMTDAVGLSPPEHVDDAWTWEQFVDALERVKPHAAVAASLHMDEPGAEWLTYAFSPLIWSNGGRLIDVRDHRVAGVLDSPASVDAIRKWQSLFKRGLAEATTTNPNPFAAGLAAFDWTGHWMVPSFEAAKGLDFGVMPLPRVGAKCVTASGSWCWGISRDCKDKALAWEVLAWFVSPEHGIRPMVEANGAVPGRPSAFKYFPKFKKMPYRLFREQLEKAGRARPRTAVYLSLTHAFADALRDISVGADVKKRLTQAANEVQRILDRSRH